jgi:hypothetical protein
MKRPSCYVKGCDKPAFCLLGNDFVCMEHLVEWDKKQKEKIKKSLEELNK